MHVVAGTRTVDWSSKLFSCVAYAFFNHFHFFYTPSYVSNFAAVDTMLCSGVMTSSRLYCITAVYYVICSQDDLWVWPHHVCAIVLNKQLRDGGKVRLS